nr:MAG TPA: hypothetical protein [Caudoviricetes sp.]
MKPILINNITKRRIRLLDKFLKNSKLFGCYVVITVKILPMT